jgi:NADH-quinone oxidoreductase subunit M
MSKVPMPPFHIWLPKAHVEAHTSGSIILAGILLKLAVFGFYRFCLLNFSDIIEVFIPLIYLLSLIGVLFASFSALRQTDVKRIIAYSSIAHMNLVVMGLFTNNELGLIGALLQSLSHGFVSGALFFLIGVLYDRFHTRLLIYYKGLILFMPVFSLFFIFFNFANVAFPGTSSFIGEFLILTSIFQYYTVTVLFAGLGIIFGVCYTLWLVNRICFTNLSYIKIYTGFKNSDLNLREIYILFFLTFFVLLFGLIPSFLFNFI